MSQSVEVADSGRIPIGRRVLEILLEYQETKGNAYTERAFSDRIGITRYKLSESMKNDRPLSPLELEMIAQGFGLSVERLKGQDTRELEEELSTLVKLRSNLKRALDIAQRLLPVVLGATQRFNVLNNLGAVYHYLGRYKEAHDAWLQAFPYAKKLQENYGDLWSLSKVTSNLIVSYTLVKDFSGLNRFIDEIDVAFEEFNVEYSGSLNYSHAMVAYNMGDLETCKKRMYKHLHFHIQSQSKRLHGIAYHNVGYIEYLTEQHGAAKGYFEKALPLLSEYADLKYIVVCDYVKCLFKLGGKEKSISIVEETLNELTNLELSEFQAKFLLLHAHLTNSFESAEKAFSLSDVSKDVKLKACRFLMTHYSSVGDSVSLMKYYKVAEELNQTSLSLEEIR